MIDIPGFGQIAGYVTREEADKIVAGLHELTADALIQRAAVPMVRELFARTVRVPEHYVTAVFDYMNEVDSVHAEHTGRCADMREVDRRMFEAFRDFYHAALILAAQMADIEDRYRHDHDSHGI